MRVSISTRLAGLRAVLMFDNWPMLLLGRLFDRKAGFVVYRKNGCEILIDHHGGDEAGTRECITSDLYRRYLPTLELRGPLRVLDLGANGGGFPLMLKIEGFEVARAVCVEMNPLTFQRLQVNLGANFGASAVALNAAVCGPGQPAEILLKPSRGGTSESIYAYRTDAATPHVAVRTTTLEAICDENFGGEPIDICKIDIEGAEYEALEACSDEVLRRIRHLVIEFHDPARTPAALTRFAALGFSLIGAEKDHRTGAMTEVRVFRGPAAQAAQVAGRSAA
jgi:FkbM family methyltransferase